MISFDELEGYLTQQHKSCIQYAMLIFRGSVALCSLQSMTGSSNAGLDNLS
jgi:hypothetical protein